MQKFSVFPLAYYSTYQSNSKGNLFSNGGFNLFYYSSIKGDYTLFFSYDMGINVHSG